MTAREEQNRRARRLIFGALVIALALVALPAPANAAFPGENGKIVVARNGDLYTFNPDGSALTNVTNSGGSLEAGSPAWSADGTKIAFSSGGDVWVTNADGSGTTNLTQHPATDVWPSWSPDGTKIAFTTDRDFGSFQIYAMNSNGTNQTNLTSNNYFWNAAPAWSPDGTRIAFETEREQDNFNGAIWAMDADGGNQTDLTQNLDFNGYLEPNWSPDGSKIALASANVNTPGLFTMNADGTNLAPLPNASADRDPAWSPDGQKIVFEDPGGIATINPDGTGKSGSLGTGADPDWQPVVNLPPSCSGVTADPAVLLRPYGRFRMVTLLGATDPNNDPLTLTITGVTQDEPVTGRGDHTSPDAAVGDAPNQVRLRAERNRQRRADGRVYRVAFDLSDGQGGTCSGVAKVEVPTRRGVTAVDSAPPSYDSFGG